MYLDSENQKAKVGRVSVDFNLNKYRLRWTYPTGNRNQIRLICEWEEAIRVAKIINRDIELNDVDLTYARYSAKYAQSVQIAQKQPNLVDLWESYKVVSKSRVAATTIKKHWTQYEKHYLGKTPPELLEINKASEFIGHLLTRYATGSILPIMSNCLNPSVNLAVKTGKLERNPYAAIPLTKKPKKPIEAYEPHEVKAIVSAFYSDEYVKPSSVYPHSYYAPMIEFLALTGCRPSECHALTWEDVKIKKDRTYIRFNKAYSQGILLPHTKTYEIRLFPVNRQLERLLESIVSISNVHNLIFPSVSLGYVNQKTFGRRYWNTVVKGLMADGKLEKKYRNYSLRHSFITRLVRSGEDIATIARISGNSTETIVNFYLSAKKNGFDIPEL